MISEDQIVLRRVEIDYLRALRPTIPGGTFRDGFTFNRRAGVAGILGLRDIPHTLTAAERQIVNGDSEYVHPADPTINTAPLPYEAYDPTAETIGEARARVAQDIEKAGWAKEDRISNAKATAGPRYYSTGTVQPKDDGNAIPRVEDPDNGFCPHYHGDHSCTLQAGHTRNGHLFGRPRPLSSYEKTAKVEGATLAAAKVASKPYVQYDPMTQWFCGICRTVQDNGSQHVCFMNAHNLDPAAAEKREISELYGRVEILEKIAAHSEPLHFSTLLDQLAMTAPFALIEDYSEDAGVRKTEFDEQAALRYEWAAAMMRASGR